MDAGVRPSGCRPGGCRPWPQTWITTRAVLAPPHWLPSLLLVSMCRVKRKMVCHSPSSLPEAGSCSHLRHAITEPSDPVRSSSFLWKLILWTLRDRRLLSRRHCLLNRSAFWHYTSHFTRNQYEHVWAHSH